MSHEVAYSNQSAIDKPRFFQGYTLVAEQKSHGYFTHIDILDVLYTSLRAASSPYDEMTKVKYLEAKFCTKLLENFV